jgi:nucleoside phosphorylase
VPKILVTFALRQEGVSFERRLSQCAAGAGMIAGRLESCQVGVTWLGMRLRNEKQFEDTVAQFRPDIVINSGFAGAVRTLFEPGDFLLAENFSAAEIVKRLESPFLFSARGAFDCVDEVAGPGDKMRRNAEGKVIAVDMESARFAKICRKCAVAFVTARMVSDRYNEGIPRLFLGKGLARATDIFNAVGFASRMIKLRPRLADRLTALINLLLFGDPC